MLHRAFPSTLLRTRFHLHPVSLAVRGLWLALLCGMASTSVPAQTSEALLAFDEGNRLYEQGDYAAALAAYQNAEAHGEISAALYYNIGNTFFRLNQLGRSILYYERARRLDPTDPTLLHNLRVARSRTEDRISQIPEPVWIRAVNRSVALVGVPALFSIGLLFYLCAAALLARRIWSGRRNDWLRRGILLTSAAAVAFLGMAFLASFERATNRDAVVLDTRTDLYETPEPDAPVTTSVHEGLVVDLLGSTDAWHEVRLPNGVTGWIPADAVEEV